MTIMPSTPIFYSKGTTKYDNVPTQRTALDFDAFEAAILSERSSAKGRGYFCCAFSFGKHPDAAKFPNEAHYRNKSSALPRAFLCLDHDGYRDRNVFEGVLLHLHQYRGFAYSTWSHTEEKPRARIVLSLSREVNREEGIALGEAFDLVLEELFGMGAIESDPCVHLAEQPCFAPGHAAKTYHFEGSALDVDEMLESQRKSQLILGTAAMLQEAQRRSEPYARLTQESLDLVLSRIDPTYEPIWYHVACALARVFGPEALETYLDFSSGAYWSEPYEQFDEAESRAKYRKALSDVQKRPRGYSMRHLIQLAGLDSRSLKFETPCRDIEEATLTEGRDAPAQINTLVLPVRDARNRPQNVQENLRAVLDAHRVEARYNQIKKRSEVIVPGLMCVADEVSNTACSTVTDLAIKACMSPARVPELLDTIAAQNPFCPVQAYILSKPWNGESQFHKFFGQFQIVNASIERVLMRKWLVQAVGAAFSPDGISNAGVIIFQGEQGIGKTRSVRDLTSGVPDLFAEGVTLNPADKDSVLNVVTHWIVELGELEATFRRSDLAQLKAFITRPVDIIRRPYARRESSLVRRTVFAGTVNDLQCLNDHSGNRRFWPIAVRGITRNPFIDYQQLWAEVYSWYLAGERWYLSDAERLALENHCESFLVSDPDVEALLDYYPFNGCSIWRDEKMKDICWNIGIEKPTKGQTMKIAEAIRRYNGGQAPRKSNGVSLHRVPDQVKIRQIEEGERKQKALADAAAAKHA